MDDGTTVAEAGSGKTQANDQYEFISGFVIHTFTAGVHTIDIEYQAVTNTAKIRRARLEIYPVP